MGYMPNYSVGALTYGALQHNYSFGITASDGVLEAVEDYLRPFPQVDETVLVYDYGYLEITLTRPFAFNDESASKTQDALVEALDRLLAYDAPCAAPRRDVWGEFVNTLDMAWMEEGGWED